MNTLTDLPASCPCPPCREESRMMRLMGLLHTFAGALSPDA